MPFPMVGSINNPEGHEARKSKAKFRQWESDEFSTAEHRAKNHSPNKAVSFFYCLLSHENCYFLITPLFDKRLMILASVLIT